MFRARSHQFLSTAMDSLLCAADNALRTLFAKPHASQASPAAPFAEADLDPAQKRLAGALMRVNMWARCAHKPFTRRRPR